MKNKVIGIPGNPLSGNSYMLEHESLSLMEYMNDVLHDPNNEEELKAVLLVQQGVREVRNSVLPAELPENTIQYSKRNTGTPVEVQLLLDEVNDVLTRSKFGCSTLPNCDGNRDGGPGCGSCVILDINNIVMKLERSLEGPYYNK